MRLAPGLAALALRRALNPAVVAGALALGALVLLADPGPPEELLATVGADGGRVARGLARQGAWAAVALAVLPWLAHRGAATAAEWRRGEVDWIGALPLSRAAALASSGLGLAAAALVLCAGGAVVAELAAARGAPAAGPALRRVRALPAPEVVLVEPGEEARWMLEDPRGRLGPRSRVRATLAPGGGARATGIELRVRRLEVGGAPPAVARARVAGGRTRAVAAVPPGTGPVEVVLAKDAGGGVVALVPGELELLEELPDPPAPGPVVAARLLVAGVGLAAAGLALGAWMGPGLATLLALALVPAGWLLDAPGAWWPAAELPAALEQLGQGLEPRGVGPLAWPAAGLWAVVGVAAAARGLRGGRDPR